jgi:hypothetical protein
MVGLIGCIHKYDYNIVVGLGLIYLGSKHNYLYNLYSVIGILFVVLCDDCSYYCCGCYADGCESGTIREYEVGCNGNLNCG